jgi:RNA polymerase sigma factor (sigma-70 family)
MTEAMSPDAPRGAARAPWLRSDDRLARRATKGDKRAFEAIYERYHQDLYRYCLGMLGNTQDAQDTLQNTMLKVLRALPGEERKIQLKPWLYRIARNEAIETIRARRDTAEIEPEQLASASSLEIAESAEARDRLRRLFADLGQLPERQRAALVMRELGGLGFEEIGAVFNSSAAVARQTIYEARRSLRQMEAGREMTCDEVMRRLSDADGRVTRRRELRAHVRSCRSCRHFQEEITQRRGDLAAIAPLPLAASAGLLHAILAGKASGATSAGAGVGAASGAGAGVGAGTGAGAGTGGGLASTIGAGAGKAVATSALVKSAAAAVVVAAVGVSAADRTGLIDVPIPGVHHAKTAPVIPGRRAAAHQHAGAAEEQGSTAASQGGAPANARAGTAASAGTGAGHHQGSATGTERSGAARSAGHPANARAPHHRHHRYVPATELPPPAEHGQETSAAHKPAPAPTPPQSHPSGGSETAPKPTVRPPKEVTQPETAPPTEPRSEIPEQAGRRALEAQELEP